MHNGSMGAKLLIIITQQIYQIIQCVKHLLVQVMDYTAVTVVHVRFETNNYSAYINVSQIL